MKRKFQFKIIVEKTEKPPVKKRKRLNTQEPLSYLFDTTFPVLSNIAFPASLNTNTIAAQKQLEQLEQTLDGSFFSVVQSIMRFFFFKL